MIYPQSLLSLGARWPTLDREAGTTLTPLRCFGKSRKGGITSSELPPPVREEEFQAVDTTNEGAIREYFHDFIDELHTFLNHNSCLRDVQRIRRRNWRPRSNASYPFGEDSFVVQSRHWYKLIRNPSSVFPQHRIRVICCDLLRLQFEASRLFPFQRSEGQFSHPYVLVAFSMLCARGPGISERLPNAAAATRITLLAWSFDGMLDGSLKEHGNGSTQFPSSWFP
jgi:hypothetical protein